MSAQPIIFSTQEDKNFLHELSDRVRKDNSEEKAGLLLSYPTVYIHFWPGKQIEYVDNHSVHHSYYKYNVYVGESNNVISRTKQHYDCGIEHGTWQYIMTHSSCVPQMIIVGHKFFNKSFTLDMENRLIEYMMASDHSVETLHNGRGNPQNEYYPVDAFEEVFHSVWRGLRKIKPDLFLSESAIQHSALYKASPLKKLTEEQIDAKETIIAKIYDAIESGLDDQLIFVQGEAGTGKTVLNSSIFYEILENGEELFGRKIDAHILVNHDQQITVYEQIAKRLGLGDNRVHKPTHFIHQFSDDNKVDVAFVDEAHLLLTRGNQGYSGSNQLEDIIKRSRVTVVMFDEYQVLNNDEYWEPDILEKFKSIAFRQHSYIGLSQQLRMQCSLSTRKWLDDFVLVNRLTEFPGDNQYEVRSFDSPMALHNAIKAKSKDVDTRLSRLVATYDWEYNGVRGPDNKKYWGVEINGWDQPWNYETLRTLSQKEKAQIRNLAWAEQPHTIDEVGSTYTIQGFDLSYVGVILGPSVKYRNGEVVFDPLESWNKKATTKRTLSDGTMESFGKIFIRNEVKVLLSRGVKGLYIYACDNELRNALKTIAKI